MRSNLIIAAIWIIMYGVTMFTTINYVFLVVGIAYLLVDQIVFQLEKLNEKR